MSEIVFHIGHHKTGTTWLQNTYFRKNEVFNLLNNPQKPWLDELCRNIIGTEEFDPRECYKIIKKREKKNRINIISAERLSGHPISGGYDAPKIAKRLFQICPTAKIIMTIRDPKAFIISVYKQMIREGYCGNLENFLLDENWKTAKTSVTYFKQKEIVSIYRQLFGPENVLVLNFNEFINNKNVFLRRIEDFLMVKVNINQLSLEKKINKSFSDKRLKALRNLNRIRKTEFNPFPMVGINTTLARHLSSLLGIFYSKKPLIDFEVVQKYLEENEMNRKTTEF